jgi:hypothetical protein
MNGAVIKSDALGHALAAVAINHISTPIDLGIEFHPELDPPIWVACVTLYLGPNDQPAIAEGNGATVNEALKDLLVALETDPPRILP